MPQVPTNDDEQARMSAWFDSVSYVNDYAGALPDTDAEDPTDGEGSP